MCIKDSVTCIFVCVSSLLQVFLCVRVFPFFVSLMENIELIRCMCVAILYYFLSLV